MLVRRVSSNQEDSTWKLQKEKIEKSVQKNTKLKSNKNLLKPTPKEKNINSSSNLINFQKNPFILILATPKQSLNQKQASALADHLGVPETERTVFWGFKMRKGWNFDPGLLQERVIMTNDLFLIMNINNPIIISFWSIYKLINELKPSWCRRIGQTIKSQYLLANSPQSDNS